MTSNIGSHLIAELEAGATEPQQESMREQVLAVLRQHFRPEFLNRIDDVIVFSRLDQAQIREIVRIQLRELEKRLEDREMRLDINDECLDFLAKEGYDPTFGARPLKRVIQRRLQDPIARAILDGTLAEGDVIGVSTGDDGLTIHKTATAEPKVSSRTA
jgi:ATP-dependent Clp protease ATP-binding subunit ClpB